MATDAPPKKVSILPEGFPDKEQASNFGVGEQAALLLIRGIEHASRYGMEIEYVTDFLEEYARTKDAGEADFYACREWDI